MEEEEKKQAQEQEQKEEEKKQAIKQEQKEEEKKQALKQEQKEEEKKQAQKQGQKEEKKKKVKTIIKIYNIKFFSQIDKYPLLYCKHGPAVLFEQYVNGLIKRSYVCSACRDRKECRFYLRYGEQLTKHQQIVWETEKKKMNNSYDHQKLFIHLNMMFATSPENRSYCHNCERLILVHERDKHSDHKMTIGLTDYQMHHPTELLKPLENSKKEAQYLFSKKSVQDIINMLLELKAKQVLCIGAPRIHEYISLNLVNQIWSLLLDIDGRFHNFFSPMHYAWYNLFNHYFFNDNAQLVFKDFLTRNNGKDLYLICDPPFGGRVELISQTIRKISDLHKQLNKIESDGDHLKIMFIFPYFMEPIIREKSNPPNVTGGLRELKMSDYKVDYENHQLFKTDRTGRNYGSPIRIFTNIPLSLLKLPESDGYKYCKICQKWVSNENKHCKKCKSCTSKDGRTYIHCNKCNRCVKPTWTHCHTCQRCLLKNHECNQKWKISGRCFKCNKLGHTKNNCEASNEEPENKLKKLGKRKMISNKDSTLIKKRKKNTSPSIDFNEKSSKSSIPKLKNKNKKSSISKKSLEKNVGEINKKTSIKRQKLISRKFKSPILTRFNKFQILRKKIKLSPTTNEKLRKVKTKLINKMKVEDISSTC
ncbi:PREDICTED: zinc finger CCHC domain-containing protein 4 [Polistes canadensis]|uniref:zinc finger CCHC domain-containing protein 4 n=1 Tax=Polistes canadensis TaxID=91411 RepID=UPI000718F57D|nr:PREDICTED: zinc finger CCHC domain-containing protein 4 [Polistes canadensis]